MPVGREGEEGRPEPWAFTRAQTCGEEGGPAGMAVPARMAATLPPGVLLLEEGRSPGFVHRAAALPTSPFTLDTWVAGCWGVKGAPPEPQGPRSRPAGREGRAARSHPSPFCPALFCAVMRQGAALGGAGPTIAVLTEARVARGPQDHARVLSGEQGQLYLGVSSMFYSLCESETTISNYTPGPSHRPPTFLLQRPLAPGQGGRVPGCLEPPLLLRGRVQPRSPFPGAPSWAWLTAVLAGRAAPQDLTPASLPAPSAPAGQRRWAQGGGGGNLACSPHPLLPFLCAHRGATPPRRAPSSSALGRCPPARAPSCCGLSECRATLSLFMGLP